MKRTKDDVTITTTRRRWPRRTPDSIPNLKGIVLNQGNQARIVDISCGGALIETDVRLHPNTKTVFKMLTTQGVSRVAGSVLRSSIKSLVGTPIYQSAIVFDNPLDIIEDLELDVAEKNGIGANATIETEIINEAAEEINTDTSVNTSQAPPEYQPVYFETQDAPEQYDEDINPSQAGSDRIFVENKPAENDGYGRFTTNTILPDLPDSNDEMNNW